MITKNDILQMVRHVIRKSKGMPDRKLMHPIREWGIGLIVAAIVLVIGVGYNAYMFSYYYSIEDQVVENTPEIETYRSNVTARVLEAYTKRNEQFQQLRANAPVSTISTTTNDGESLEVDESDTETEERDTQ